MMTDIVGSTPLWDLHPNVAPEVIATHDALIAAVVAQHNGELIRSRGEGDSTFSVFSRVTNALDAATATQLAIQEHIWPDDILLQVRIALHSGEVVERDGDYMGGAINRAARIRALAKGRQILLSATTAQLLADHMPPGAQLRELGRHSLTGLRRDEHIFEVVMPGRDAIPSDQSFGESAVEVPSSLNATGFSTAAQFTMQSSIGLSNATLNAAGTTIGRHAASDIVLGGDELVSRHHATVEFRHGSWWIRDNTSRNGTRVDGVRIVDATPLRHGVDVQIGATVLTFLLRASDPDATVSDNG